MRSERREVVPPSHSSDHCEYYLKMDGESPRSEAEEEEAAPTLTWWRTDPNLHQIHHR